MERIRLTLMAFALAVSGCKKDREASGSKPADREPAPAAAASAKTSDEPTGQPLLGTALADRYLDCWKKLSAHEWDSFRRCYAPDATSTQTGVDRQLTGRDQIVDQAAKQFARAFPDGGGEVQLVLVSGREIVGIVRIHGTNTGPLTTPQGEIPATGRKFGYLMVHRVRINDANQVEQEWWVHDIPTLRVQLGFGTGPARPVQEQDWPGHPVVVVARDDDNERKNVGAHRRVYELFGRKDPKLAELFADDIVQVTPSEPQDTVGKPALMEVVQSVWKGFPDVGFDIELAFGTGEYTVLSGKLQGTNTGDVPSLGLKKTGRNLILGFVEIIRWKDGKAVASYPFFNKLEMATQLGLVPPAR